MTIRSHSIRTSTHGSRAFTLIEIVVVIGIVAMLISMLLPSLSAAREQAKAVVCTSNIRQIMLANEYYKDDYRGVYCPGASDFRGNLHRWHGARNDRDEPFVSTQGPLVPYLGAGAAIRQCPTFPADEIARESGGFERGNGGYGYNNAFLGMQVNEVSANKYEVTNDKAGAMADRIRRPAKTVMFTDAAFAASRLIEYSFATPRFHPQYPRSRPVPSIHFRHHQRANVGWCDGHVDAQPMTYTEWNRLYRADPKQFDIGWFGETDDNRLFDLK